LEVSLDSVKAGDTVVIQAGQIIPVDGVIIGGIATVDQQALTGESQPVEKGEGDRVLTSTLMVGGRIFVRVEKTGEETVAAQIGVMLNKTASYQASIVSRGEAVADRSVPPTMALALIALPVSGYRYMVTVIGSAIGLNIKLTAPIAMLNFLNVAANHGILIKDGRSLELLKDVDTVVFDKTGTLTLDEPEIASIHVSSALEADTILMYAAAAEHRQTHPIARAILAEAGRRALSLPEVDAAQVEVGYGLTVRLDGYLVRVGSERYMALEQIPVPTSIRELGQSVHDQGHSLVMVAVNGDLVGAIELQPTLRPGIQAVIDQLRARKLDICIISGDQDEPTRKMAGSLGIDRYFANTLPEEKAELVESLQREGRSVCFVGDGINDSISLKKANVSVSLRGASTAATDTAQVVLMGEGLQRLPFLFQLAEEFDANMRAGFAVAVGQGVVVICGALLSVVGIIGGTVIWSAGLVAGLGIAYLPLRRHKILQGAQLALLPGHAWIEGERVDAKV
jgi:Cu2+-exporting ATPase